jgi:phosphoglycolate phosphatase
MPKKLIMQELERLRLNGYFRLILTSQDVDEPKPSPQAFAKAAEQLGVPVCECAVIGDAIVDIQAGKSAGARTIAVLSGLFSHEEMKQEKPDLIIKDRNALQDFFKHELML